MENAYIQFYGEKDISPVRQDISDLRLHLRRREKLYRQLGMPFCLFRDRRILEVGPGSGYNALALLLGGVGKMDLVEPNPRGISDMQALFEQYGVAKDRYEIFPVQIEAFRPQRRYEVILAEGFLACVGNALEIVERLFSMLADGGVLVVTCSDELSLFVEQMKSLVAYILIRDIQSYEEQVAALTAFFTEQFSKLTGMSRSVEEWVVDNILNPAVRMPEFFGMDKLLEWLPENAHILGTSQSMFTDYSWYKDVDFDVKKDYRNQFRKKQHNLMLVDEEETLLSPQENQMLNAIATSIRKHIIRYWENHEWDEVARVMEKLAELEPLAARTNERLLRFVQEARQVLQRVKAGDWNLKEYPAFCYAMGRSQQYVSLVKANF